METQQAKSASAYVLARRDLRPSRGEAAQVIQALNQLKSVKYPFSMQSIQSRGALDLASPPTDNGRILFKQVDPACAVFLVEKQGPQG